MKATFLMSYPPANWQIRGGENFRSRGREATRPRAAMKEWLTLADAIVRAGGRILVVPPPEAVPPLTGMIYTANSGALFQGDAGPLFMLSKMSVAHRQSEREPLRKFLVELGLRTVDALEVWEGQADVCTFSGPGLGPGPGAASAAGNRFLLTWGVRSVKRSLEEVRQRLPMGAHVLDLQLREPFFHGDTCLDLLQNRAGDAVLLAHGGALADRTLDLRDFIGPRADVVAVDEADALGYACNALCVDGTVLMPTGLSGQLHGELVRRGFQLEELELVELFGKGGGGPRCMVNQLHGFEPAPNALDYAVQRVALEALADRYPDVVS